MTLRQGTALGIRLVGLSMLLQFAVNIPQTIVYVIYLTQQASANYGVPGHQGVADALFSVAGHVTAGLVLVIMAAPLSGWLLVDPDPERPSRPLVGADFFRCGIALVGLAIVVISLPALLASLADLRGIGRPDWYREQNPVNVQAKAFSEALRILLGAILVRQAATIAGSVRKLWPGEPQDEQICD